MKKLAIFFIMVCFFASGIFAQQNNNMVRINGGTFTMGSPTNEVGRNTNEEQRQVTVSAFWMGKFEVTQKEYQQIMGYNPSRLKGDNLPVEQVTWFDAVEYCNKLSEKEGLTPVYTITDRKPAYGRNGLVGATVTANWDNNGYRLPTEAEWEYACRAGSTTPFSTGDNITTSQANYNGNVPYNNNDKGERRRVTTPVGSFPANEWGLHDMHGNVAEWCWDYLLPYAKGAQTNPRGATTGTIVRVVRGGGYEDSGRDLRTARRGNVPGPNDNLGFRVVRSGS